MKANYRNLEVDSTIYEKSVIVLLYKWLHEFLHCRSLTVVLAN